MTRLSRTCILAVVAGLALVPGGRAADAGSVTLEIVPEKVSLEAATSQHVLVVARNTGAEVRDVALSWLPAAQIVVKPMRENARASLEVARLAQGEDAAWRFEVSAQPAARAQKLFFRVDYTSGSVGKIATAAVDVENAAPEKVEDVAAVVVKTTLESLDRSNPGVVYLIVTNKLATPLTVDKVEATGPESVDFAGPDRPATIGARQSRALEVDVDAKERVRPGKHLLLFDMHLEWGQGREARVITTHQAQIGVVGESTILTLLGVPTFLLLPGFLIMLTIATWWRFGVLRPGGAPAQAPFEFTEPDFWVLAITASILIGLLYPHVGGVDYLHGAYGLIDIVVVWVASLLLGTLIWFGVMGTRRFRQWRRSPSEDDNPLTILHRLGRQGLTVERPRYKFDSAGTPFNGYLVVPRADGEAAWFAPQIAVAVNATDGGQLSTQLAELKDAEQFAKKLKSRLSDVTISWEAGAGPDRPYRKTAKEIEAAERRNAERIVRVS